MSLEQEIRFKEQELAKLRERVGQDHPGAKKLRGLWNSLIDILLKGEGLHYEQYFWILTQLIHYQHRYGHLLGSEVEDGLAELDPVIRERLERRGWFMDLKAMLEREPCTNFRL